MDTAIIALNLARYRFHWLVKTPLRLPPYAGSTLRGVFGRMLKQQVCLTQADSCKGCPLRLTCAYSTLFEPQIAFLSVRAQAPYAIETSFRRASAGTPKDRCYREGERYHFDMVLMTPAAIKQLPLIISVWQRAFAKGVGLGNGKATLLRVEQCLADGTTAVVYDQQCPGVRKHSTQLAIPAFEQTQDLQLYFQTPLRIQQRGKLIDVQNISASLLLRNLIRRVSFHINSQQKQNVSLAEIHHLNALADQVQEGEKHLRWCDWERYSTRQKQKMKLGGLIGYWQLLQLPSQLQSLLYLGQWLHVGKESVFGLGKYQMEPLFLVPPTRNVANQ